MNENSINILITGSAGLFGTAMEKACEMYSVNVIGLSRTNLDISDKNQLEKKIDEYAPTVIINTAAMLGIPACEENPVEAFKINAIPVFNLAKICKERNIILVQISSNSVFDGRKKDLYFETDIPNPQNIYGLSKYAAEICVQNNLSSYYIMRFPKLFGSRRNNTLGFVDKMLHQMKNGAELKIADDRFDTFTYTMHAAKKTLSLLQNKAPFGIYHIANQGTVSFYDFIDTLAKKINYNGEIIKAKDRDFHSLYQSPLRNELGSEKIKDMPGWKEALDDYLSSDNIHL